MKKSLVMRITAITLGMIMLCALATSLVSYIFYRSDSVADSAWRALDIARSCAAIVDGDEMSAILESREMTESWHALKAALDRIATATDAKYLYVLDCHYDDQVTYYVEGYNANANSQEPLWLGYQEDAGFYDSVLFEKTLATGEDSTSEITDSGIYGMVISGFVAVRDSKGAIVGVVGVDLDVAHVSVASRNFALRLIGLTVGLCVVLSIVSIWVTNRMVRRPVQALTSLSNAVAQGDIHVEVTLQSEDELGELAGAFRSIIDSTKNQAQSLEAIAAGDLTHRPAVRSEGDVINQAIVGTVDNLTAMFGDIQSMAGQVSIGASQMADGSQALAHGATQQAAAVEQLQNSIVDILRQSEESTQQAASALDANRRSGVFMQQAMDSMGRMTEAMGEITTASKAISQVISVIDNIAFQTNILSLNASVEAARAGQHGKGFAVVAEEVRNLAAKSSRAAKETADLIQNSIVRVQDGTAIAQETSQNLDRVAELATQNIAAVTAISEASARQSSAIAEINQGIEQISTVVQRNSATAEESAASSHEMNAQAQMLTRIVGRFKLESRPALGRTAPAAALPPHQAAPQGQEAYALPSRGENKYF